ncbi:hypothetical protein [Paludibacter sp.]|uniref:hypothetical protein n=1 Tax=Paludibacter sp. TaxID=1898105 RepID=UPI0013546383|nr:hypothetical protein [Paludibacter sp.]MTK52679.1 hypothetical protein [Paludibacter sp.]
MIGIPASGQNYFRIIGGIPHLPVVEPSAVATPELGMLIYSTTEANPLIFNGTGWETLCTNNITASTAQDYFVVKNGIPFLPSLSDAPLNPQSGSVYYSTITKSVMVYNGTTWSKMTDLLLGSITDNNSFTSGSAVKTYKLPVISNNPSPTGLSAGAFYVNSTSKTIRFYNGTDWQDVMCHPIVITAIPTNITGYTATGGGNILSNGGSNITLRGICWSPLPNPDTLSTSKTREIVTGSGVGSFTGSLTNLMPKTTYYVRAYAVNANEIVYGQTESFLSPVALPTIITLDPKNITNISAESGGNITADGGAPVTQRGIIWSSLGDPASDPSCSITNDGSGVGSYPSSLTSLLGNTTYYVRAYAVNSAGKAYGNLLQFVTPAPSLPVFDATLVMDSITGSSAVGTAKILNNGGAIITERGICYSTDNINYQCVASTSVPDIGSYRTKLTGLTEGTTYYVKPYAKNSAGIGYGTETSFVTAAHVKLTTVAPSNVTGTSASSGGIISDIGFYAITSKGVCWSTDKNPTVDLPTKTSESITGDGSANFTSSLTSLIPGTKYYFRAYAVNPAGVSYGNLDSLTTLNYPTVITLNVASFFNDTGVGGGNVLSDGGAPVTSRGICWSTSANPTISSYHTSDGNGTGIYFSSLTGLATNVTYHVRAYAINSVGVAYGEDKTFVDIPEAPQIITLDITNITSISAESGGNITSNGGASITKRGILWSTKGDPIDDPSAIITDDGSGVGLFPSTLTNLLGSTTYYVRAYAVNAFGKAYGNLLQFTTLPPVIPALNSAAISITDITDVSAVGTLDVINNGGAPVTSRGICYSTDRINYVYVPSNTVTGSDVGTFVSNLTGLTPNTTYYAKGYATNGVGTGYSSEVSFITAGPATITTTHPTSIAGFSAVSGGTITDPGNSVITSRGICWSSTGIPSYTDSHVANGSGVGTYSCSLSGLTPGVKYYVRAYAFNAAGVSYGNLDSLKTLNYPVVKTLSASSFYNNTGTCGGNVISDGGSAILDRGVCWSTSENPTISSYSASAGSGGLGMYFSTMTGLTANVTYHVRAYALNSVGYAYGEDKTFTIIPEAPTIITLDASDITSISALSGGNITSNGGSSITKRGIMWSTTGDPTDDPSAIITDDGSGVGLFPSTLTSLMGSTTYYVRAYAVNSYGKAYGNIIQFTTPPPVIPAISSASINITNITGTSADGTVTILNNGGAPVTARGICWSTDNINYTYVQSQSLNLTDLGSYKTTITGLTPGTTYYVKGFATNSAGTAYSSEVSFITASLVPVTTTTPSNITYSTASSGGIVSNTGNSVITARGICWSIGNNPTVALTTKTSESLGTDGTGSFTSTMTGLMSGVKYYVRAYATNSAGTSYGNLDSLTTTPPVAPFVTTVGTSSVSGSSAIISGEVTSEGGDAVTERGICWSTSPSPTIDKLHASNGNGAGTYNVSVSGLTGGVTYYARAYAVNSIGIGYGDDIVFTTDVAPTLTTVAPTSVTNASAISGGSISSDGGDPVSSRGVCWSTIPNPTLSDSHTTDGYGTGIYTSNITGLYGSTRYYLRAYAVNSAGIAYGDEVSFITASPMIPTVTTVGMSNVAGTTAEGDGNISSNGGADIIERGICWGIAANPTIDSARVSCGTGTGNFAGILTGLKGNTLYHVRAYATNSVGIAYGNDITFKTVTTPTIITSAISAITGGTAQGGGTITSDGGSAVTSSGICWNNSGMPTIDNVHTTGTIGIGEFIHKLTGLRGNTWYYVRAYAINSAGIAYGNVVTFLSGAPELPTVTTVPAKSGADGVSGVSGGVIVSNGGAQIMKTGVCWSTVSGFIPDTVLYNRTIQTDTVSFNSTFGKLRLGTTYYVRAYATNGIGTGYGDEVPFTTYNVPMVSTTNASMVTNVSARSGGSIVSNGGTIITASGICWSTSHNPTLSNDHLDNAPGEAAFTSDITNLLGSTVYYARAYATNSAGTAYGNEISFTTQPPTIATIVTNAAKILSGTSVSCGGTITSNGGAIVTTRGLYWCTSPNFNTDTIKHNRTAETGYFTGSYTHNMDGLLPNTVYYVKAYVVNSAGVAYGDEVSFKTPALPTLTTLYASATGSTKATSGGEISDDGGATVTTRGVVWSTIATFNADTVTVNKTYNGSGTGDFISTITGLRGNTTYYIKAYATNIAGKAYGNLLSFITDPPTLATLTTRDAWYIGGTTAYSGGYISDNGGEPVTTRGMMWSTVSGFRPDTVTVNKISQTGTGNGYFTTLMNGLKPGTTYYIRAFAINSVGVAYGNELSFTTLITPSLTTKEVTPSANGVSASGGGTIISDGGGSITNQGVCWSTGHNPTVSLYTKTTYDSGSGSFNSTLTGLKPATTYYVRAYAVNSQGVGYGNEVSFTTPAIPPTLTTNYTTTLSTSSVASGGNITSDGGAAVTSRGILWSTNANFVPDTVTINKTIDGTGTGNFTSIVTGMSMSMSYYFRAYATNSAGTAYGNQVSVTIFPTAPRLITVDINSVGGYTALSGGQITSDGGAPVTLKGLCWATHTNPTVDDYHTYNGSGTDSYVSTMTGLAPNTLYYVRAYAINKIGTAYGLEKTFLTDALPTLTATKPVTNIVATTGTSGGEITDDGRSPIIARGICWSIYSNPTVSLTTKTVDNTTTGIGTFTANMAGLQPETTYYVRAYATNAVGTGYGSQVTFKTLPVMLPTITTTPHSYLDSTKAISGGTVINDGGMPVNVRGVCWSLDRNPNVSLASKLNDSSGGLGSFTSTVTGLSPGTKYYLRAFATNSLGTGYGELDSLTTQPIRPVVSAVAMSNLTMTNGVATATVITNGGATITDSGFYWNTTGKVPVYPTPVDSTLSVGAIGSPITGTVNGIQPNTTYYIWAYATNSEGTRYSSVPTVFTTPTIPTVVTMTARSVGRYTAISGGTVTKDGGVPVTGRGVCYSYIGLPTIDSTKVAYTTGGTGSYSVSLSGLKEGTKYYVRAYATNSMGTGYGQVDTLTTLTIPTVITANADSIWSSGVAIGGEVTASGGSTVTSRGVCWSATVLPTVDLTTKTVNGSGLGKFKSSVTGLTHSTIYYIRAYATNSLGTAYGQTDTIKTNPVVPTLSNVALAALNDSTQIGTTSVTDDGGAPVIQRGICWGTAESPTLSNSFVIDSGTGLGSYNDTITKLVQGVTYYVRAFAKNSAGVGYGPDVSSKSCPSSFTVIHLAGFNGAPVTKNTVYHSISTNLSGAARCWLTQNLGADQQPISATDASTASAGWYWQFNDQQGYQHNGTTRTPGYTWASSINVSSQWLPANDPCNLLLALGWRIPTYAEWLAADGAPQNWANLNDGFNSVLKLHAGGMLTAASGALTERGTTGYYWTSTQSGSTTGYNLTIQSASSSIASGNSKASAMSLRCIRDGITLSVPIVTNVTVPDSTQTSTSAVANATVVSDGGASVTTRGFCWNTTGTPTISNNVISSGNGKGSFTEQLTNLSQGTTIYIRAYATNTQGTGYSPTTFSFIICPTSFDIIHTAGLNGAPVTKTVTYHSLSSNISGAARCWLTQNLGADVQPSSATDTREISAGWYWQFNSPQGFKHDGTTLTPSNAYTAWNTNYAGTPNWLSTNDPCNLLLGLGWRLPTYTEWNTANSNSNWSNATSTYNSSLKLHMAGYLSNSNGSLQSRGGVGDYWSSTYCSSGAYSYLLRFNASSSAMTNDLQTYAYPVRCILASLVKSVPMVSAVSIPDSAMTATTADGTATVGSSGGENVTTRGLCWSTTNATPSISDNIIPSGSGTGSFTATIPDIQQGVTYYVRAYATNSIGTGYSPSVSTFKICPTSFDVIHTAGLNGAPVTKTVTYHSISTKISGAPVCWLTQNLGADHQPTSVSDASEASAGWYWQFNSLQGFKHDGTTLTPSNAYTPWNTNYSGTPNWSSANDPCNLLLGLGWRLPTYTEWYKADDAPQFWQKASDAYSSVLKLHMAGYLANGSGALSSRGSVGDYWSSTYCSSGAYSYLLRFNATSSAMTNDLQTYAYPVRCIRDAVTISIPTVSNVTIPTSGMTESTAIGTATVASSGGANVTVRGLVWNTTGTPTLSDSVIANGSGLGIFNTTIKSLDQNSTYYVRAFATNSKGTAYSPAVTSFKICPSSFSVIHTAGLNGAPVTKTVTYHSISSNISGSAKCWLTQNLGADSIPSSVSDVTEASAGWYWQFNSSQGFKNDGTTLTPSNAYTAWNTNYSGTPNWASTTDPCNLLLGLGWRLPTYTEWYNANAAPQYWQKAADAYNSVLKLHMAGYLSNSNGSLQSRGGVGDFWSSSYCSSGAYSYLLRINAGSSAMTNDLQTYAYSVRCIRDGVSISIPTVSNVTIPTSTMTATTAAGTATVASNGGATVTTRGLCWSTSNATPTISDNIIPTGDGLGTFTSTMGALSQNYTYYVRAYATNSKGTAYSPTVTSFKICPTSFDVIHTAGLNGAPVTKTVTYHSISTNISGAAVCWLTQNLGADNQPTSVSDASEASAGWYWQFNSPQGFKHDGTTLTPSNAYTPWNTNYSGTPNWSSANDPCNLLLGLGWRLPTYTEWYKADDAPQFWQTVTDAYNSVLKLHMAGYLANGSGALSSRGSVGDYWSSTYCSSGAYSYLLRINATSSAMTNDLQTYAYPVRCIRDAVNISIPTVSNVSLPTSGMTESTAIGTATVASDGGATVTARGLVWNTSGTPYITDHVVADNFVFGYGLGSFSDTITNLDQSSTYYVRAFATNSKGTAYSPAVTSFKICPSSFSVIHTAGLNGAPVTKTVTYHSISSNISGSAKCWLTQNLGADSIPSSVSDVTEASAGWYWQFNSSQGFKNDGTTLTPSNAYTAWNTNYSGTPNWASTTDPCNLLLGLGWRLPTYTEWYNANAAPQYWQKAADAYNSVLKLHMAGYLSNSNGSLQSRGGVGDFWSSSYCSSGAYSYLLRINAGSSAMTNDLQTYAYSVRCIRDGVSISIPTVSNVTIPTSTMTATTAAGTATVASNGGATVTTRGLCWSTSNATPTISDNIIPTGDGLGVFTSTLTGLSQNYTYYVRAYATNSKGTAYSPTVTSFKICPTEFNIIHTAGLNGAPVSKLVTYHSISTNISGAPVCWLTQNLGADNQPTSVSDASEASAGWYWQFNSPQGFKHDGTTLTPSNAYTPWNTNYSGTPNWSSANDPCNLLLGLGWRLPTYTEWYKADDAPQFWQKASDAYSSVLKLHMAGYLANGSGALSSRGSVGDYWSSSYCSSGAYSYLLRFNATSSAMTNDLQTYAYPVRCIRDAVTISTPTVSNASVPTTGMTSTSAASSATVSLDGGDTVTERGFVWNTTGAPSTSDNKIINGSGTGSFTSTITGLSVGNTYYVRAYAINSKGTTYSPTTTSFKICPTTFSIAHTTGTNGAPETKTVTYHSISSNITGTAKCWLTQNLGADQQASSASDNTQASAGWYWQFNQPQGYAYGTSRTPSTAWNTNYSGTPNWSSANDPCIRLLGSGWRLPTYTEWYNANAAPQYFQTANDAYNSVLKLHMAGYLSNSNGSLQSRGGVGDYWSSTYCSSGAYSYLLRFNATSSAMTNDLQTYAYPVRCIKD